MSQMNLISNSRDEWTVKDLVETLHAKVDDLERKLDAQLTVNASIQWHLNAIILHLAGDRAALTAFVMASEPTVVPNEDEAMPVLAYCNTCKLTATTDADVESLFGYRTPRGRPTIVQSWCRECRSAGKDKKRTKKSPTPWSKMCPKAEAYAAAVTRAKNQIPPLQYRLDNDQLTPSERADLQRRVDTLTTKSKAAKKEYNARIKELG